jgi:exodeoxyribonuclease VIII
METIGLGYDIPADKYHADPSVSNTMLSDMAKSPAHCFALNLAPNRPPRLATDAMLAGTLCHTAILEPGSIAERYVIRPDGIDYRTKDGKTWRDAQVLPIISWEDANTAEKQLDAFLRVGALRELRASGSAEASVFWRDAATGLRCRARPDWLHPTGRNRGKVMDLKTIRDLTPEAVQRAIASYGYHRQAAHYTNGLEACGFKVEEFIFGFVSSSYPFLAAAFVLDEETLQQGRDEVAELLMLYAECEAANKWPAFGDGLLVTGLPTWAKRSNDVEIEVIA